MVKTGWSKGKSATFLLGCSATCVYGVGVALSACYRQGVCILVLEHFHFCLPANELCTLVVGFGRPFSFYIVYSRWQRLMIYPTKIFNLRLSPAASLFFSLLISNSTLVNSIAYSTKQCFALSFAWTVGDGLMLPYTEGMCCIAIFLM